MIVLLYGRPVGSVLFDTKAVHTFTLEDGLVRRFDIRPLATCEMMRQQKAAGYFSLGSAEGARYESQGQASSEARRVAPGSLIKKSVEL